MATIACGNATSTIARPNSLYADLCLANQRLALAGALTSALVVILVGTLGHAVGATFLATIDLAPGEIGVAPALGMGSALCGAVGFAVLAMFGWVLFADLIGEFESADESSRGAGRAATAVLFEAWGGLLWGTVCGIGIGIGAAVVCGFLGFIPVSLGAVVATGALSGMVVGVLAGTAQVVAAHLRGPNAVVRDWARLGPPPTVAYAFSLPGTGPCRKYLR